MIYIANAFSLGMLHSMPATLRVADIHLPQVRELLSNSQWQSAVGHETTAKLLSQLLGIEIPYNRVQLKLNSGDRVIVFQINKRLPEATSLSEEDLKEILHSSMWSLKLVEVSYTQGRC